MEGAYINHGLHAAEQFFVFDVSLSGITFVEKRDNRYREQVNASKTMQGVAELLRDCKVIVVANKQLNDSVYFSGIDAGQLLYFLKRLNYPVELVAFIESNKACLDHLQFDAGFDSARVSVLRSCTEGFFWQVDYTMRSSTGK